MSTPKCHTVITILEAHAGVNQNDLVDRDWINANSVGFAEYEAYIKGNVTLEWAAEESGIPVEVLTAVADEFAAADPATIWIGYGMQRHVNGGNNVRAIDALVAMSGNVGKVGGGARYGHLHTWGFNYHAMIQSPPEGSVGFVGQTGPMGEFAGEAEAVETTYSDRAVNINKIGQVILDTNDPPIRLLWAANKNVLSQDFDRNKIEKAFEKLEMVVVVDQFFTQTAELADIVLPTTTLFEDWTVNVSYWHYWLGINEQAIQPMFEAKSDIEIASALSAVLNSKQPGSCTFPENIDPKEWMAKEFNDNIYHQFGISSWEELKDCPVGAFSKRDDGIVVHDVEACIGCGNCVRSCPFGAPRYNEETRKAEKCSMCYQRIDAGLQPACVQSCPTGALQLIDLETFDDPDAVQFPPGFPKKPDINPSIRFKMPKQPKVIRRKA